MTQSKDPLTVAIEALQKKIERLDADMDCVIRAREHFHDMADKLANSIAAHFDVAIGEHSSDHCPWTNALEVIESADKSGNLTDEEIERVAIECGFQKTKEHWGNRYYTDLGSNLFKFARAITAPRAAADTEELVTLDSARQAIEHMEQYNGPGRKAEARQLLVRAALSQPAKEQEPQCQHMYGIDPETGSPTCEMCGEQYADPDEQEDKQEPEHVGVASYKTTGFTMAVFDVIKVPAGTKLFAAPVQQEAKPEDATLLRALAKDFYNKTIADTDVRISSHIEGKRDAVVKAGEMLRHALACSPEYMAQIEAAPPQAEAQKDDSWRTFFIVARPGKAPRIGLPIGEVAASLRQWYEHNPDAEIYVVNSWGSSAGCQTVENGREILFFADATEQAEAQSKCSDGGLCGVGGHCITCPHADWTGAAQSKEGGAE